MLVTEAGISRLANELHSLKTEPPMLVTDDGMVTLVSSTFGIPHLAHELPCPRQSPTSMAVVPSGILKCFFGICNELQPSKAWSPMLVTDGGIVRLANELHPRKAPSPILVTDGGILRLTNEVHPQKALPPMLVTDDGIVRLVNELHPWKVADPMLVTDDGISRLANDLHPLKA